MLIKELLCLFDQRQLIDISPHASSYEVATKLKHYNVGALLVTNAEQEMVGVVSERDLARAYANDGPKLLDRSAETLMTSNVISCSAKDDVFDTLKRLNEKNIRHIPVLEDGRAVAMLSIRDFEHACDELQRQATTDGLTGLANRRAFEETLNDEFNLHLRFKAPLSVAIFDIDHFKSVNDSYGHNVGDQVLKGFADVLNQESEVSGHVARLGGEEFSVLFPNTCVGEASSISEQLLVEIAESEIWTSAGNVSITLSGGVSMIQQSDKNISEIMGRADALLYRAKRAGRNQLLFDEADRFPVH